METIQLQALPEGIALLTFDRPDSAANIFDVATLDELRLRLLEIDPASRGLVLISAKPAIFIAGADISALEGLGASGLREFISLGQEVMNRLARIPCPSVAAIHGACVGGGFELALACSRRIATPDRATKIGLPETKLGILPAWGGSTRLPRLIGVPAALDIILAGKTLPAKPALNRGLIDDIVPRELLLDAAQRWLLSGSRRPRRLHLSFADRLTAAAAVPVARRRLREKTRGLYPAPERALRVVARALSGTVDQSLARERDGVLALAQTPECRNLLHVFKLQERARKLRLPDAAKPAPIQRAAVIGAGVMGAAIAQWLSARGIRVLLRDIDTERVAAGMSRISKLYADAVKARALDAKEARDGIDRISPTAAEPHLEGVDLVIEAAVEKMDLKKKIFVRLAELAPRNALLATNTSALSITELASVIPAPERLVGIHFFNPVHRMPLVEVIRGVHTGADAAARALKLVQQTGKFPVLVKDSPGFLVNRILLPYMIEAGELFAHGAPAAEVDAAMLEFGMPMGPLRLTDEVGIDVAVDVAATLAAAFPGHMHVPSVLTRMASAGMLGRKAVHGFYTHKGHSVPNPAATAYREEDESAAPSRPEMQRRMVLLMINEAARCLEEQVAAEPADADFAMIMGAGFAPFRGGPLRYADSLGLRAVETALREEADRSGPHFEPCHLIQQLSESERTFYASP